MRYSNFYITLNTNQRFNEFSEEYQIFNQKFQQTIDQLLAKDNIHNVFTLKNPNATFSKDFIKQINIEKVCELGETSKCVHLHALISVAQYTPIQLNFSFIVDFVKQKMNLPNVYFNCKTYNDSKQRITDYIKKGQKKLSFFLLITEF